MLTQILVCLINVVAATGAAHAQTQIAAGQAEQMILERGRQHTAWFYEGRLDDIWTRLSEDFRKQLQSQENLAAFRATSQASLGKEREMVNEVARHDRGLDIYTRTIRVTSVDALIEIMWAWDAGGTITGFLIRPAAKAAHSRFLDYRTKTILRLPFDGEWYVVWGGRDLSDNYHAVAVDQRFAYDFVRTAAGATHTSGGRRNEDYRCWDALIIAPAAGLVLAAVDDVSDNEPGVLNNDQPMGNHVVLDHGNGEYSVFAHFRRGSVSVKQSQRVRQGDLLGRCGNSGRSSEPHLHYHLQNATLNPRAEGLPAFFVDVSVDGGPPVHSEPRKGQTIRDAGRLKEGALDR
jgi:Peptidase family M23